MSAERPSNVAARASLADGSARARLAEELGGEVLRRFEDAANAEPGRMVITDTAGLANSPRELSLRVLDGPERTLTVLVDPVGGTAEWAFHYAGAMMHSRREDLSGFGLARVDELVRLLQDRRAWLTGAVAIREDRTR